MEVCWLPSHLQDSVEFMGVHWNIHSVAMVMWHAAQGNYTEVRGQKVHYMDAYATLAPIQFIAPCPVNAGMHSEDERCKAKVGKISTALMGL